MKPTIPNYFVDTSALYALLDADDNNHILAAQHWQRIVAEQAGLFTHNYILVEVTALIQSRLGISAVQTFYSNLIPLIQILWVGADLHELATSNLLAARKRRVSLVDWVSFEVMRKQGLTYVFAFDSDFAQLGFKCVPK